MDIHIEAPKHGSQDRTHEFYSEKLTKKYGKYDFVKLVEVKVKSEKGEKLVSLQIKPEKGKMLYTSARDRSENVAFNHAIKSMNVHIEKYKEKHYQSVHHVDKQARRRDID